MEGLRRPLSVRSKPWVQFSPVKMLFDPRLYFTIALFAGEAGPSFFPIGSGWMFIFGFVGLVMLFVRGRIKVRNKISIVSIIYVYVLLRNISARSEILMYYELPNLGTAFILLFLNIAFYRDEDIDRIGDYIFMYAAILSALGVVKFIQRPTVRLAVFGGPNGYYKIALLFEILCFSRYLLAKKRIYLGGVGLGIILCMATGSKGGIAAMIAILGLEVFYFLFNEGERRLFFAKRIIQLTIIAGAGIYLISAIINMIPGLSIMFSRASSFLYADNVEEFTSVSARTNLIQMGMDFFKESPFFGKGARYTYFYTNGRQPYPHNIFVEFLSEQGLVGTIPLVLFFLSVLFQVIKHGLRDRRLFCLFLCLSVFFSGSLFSGNILDAKPIFVFGVMMYNCVLNIRYRNT